MDSQIIPKINDLIYEIRGQQVMLDSDLAVLYGCANGTKTINQAIKRHKERFPEDFYFQLDKTEFDFLKSQVGTSSIEDNLKFQTGTSSSNKHGGVRKLPYVFTEQGVAMLSSVLRTEKAAEVSVNIMRAFVFMRRLILQNGDLFKRVISIENDINTKFIEYDDNFNKIFNELSKPELKSKIFYNGEIYDAYNLLIKIIKSAEENIVIIDSYIDNEILEIFCYKKESVKISIITSKVKNKLDINKFKQQYPNVELGYDNTFHDRFIIIDNKVLYHVGASLKDLGKSTFGITKINDQSLLDRLISETSNLNKKLV